MVLLLEVFDDFDKFFVFLIASFAAGAVEVGFGWRFAQDFFGRLSAMCEFFLSHFDDFALFVCNNFFKFVDGFFEILVSDFEELIFVVKFDFLLFFLIGNFLPVVQFIVDFLLKVLPGVVKIRFRLDVIEFRY